MKYENYELYDIGEDAIKSIELAMSELDGVEEYREGLYYLQDALEKVRELQKPYSDSLDEEEQEHLDYLNWEYERSV